jgi:DNA-binding CsgD family transcriptional regulator
MDTTVAQRSRREIIRLCHSGLDSGALRLAVLREMRKLIPIDSFWCATVDPATLLFTGSVVQGIPEHATPAFLENEFLHDDVNKFTALARGPIPVDHLLGATGGDLRRSERYREILAPLGLGDELRAVLRGDGAAWGVMCLHRRLEDPAFSARDLAFVHGLIPHLAQGLRTALLRDRAGVVRGADGPGLILMGDDSSVIATTPAADVWLEELGDWPVRDEAPQAVRAVAARLWELERGVARQQALMPRVRIRTRAGRWAVLHAARLSGHDPRSSPTAVIVEQAPSLEVAPLVLQAYNLTERETQVAELVLRGLSTKEIVAELCISALTVQDHLKSVFEKTGVSNRRSLVATIFAEQYMPPTAGGSGPEGDGSRSGG